MACKHGETSMVCGGCDRESIVHGIRMQFWDKVRKRRAENSHLRYGQILYNTFFNLCQSGASAVIGTNLDPYYHDEGSEVVDRFVSYIESIDYGESMQDATHKV